MKLPSCASPRALPTGGLLSKRHVGLANGSSPGRLRLIMLPVLTRSAAFAAAAFSSGRSHSRSSPCASLVLSSSSAAAPAVAMAFGISRALVAPLVVLNFVLYLIAAAIAGSLLNKALDHGFTFGNVVTQIFLTFALIASVVGLASTIAGAHHLRVWRGESLAAAAAAATIAWLLTLLAMGVAAKEIHTRYGRNKRLKTLEALMIILSFFELLYMLALHAGRVNRDGYPASTPRNVKDPNYGTPAATAV